MKHLLLLAALPGTLLAQTIEGTRQNEGIRLAFKIDKNGDAYQGTFYNLANGRLLNLGAITLQGNAVRIAIPGNGMNYEGKIETDGNSITGTLTQLGLKLDATKAPVDVLVINKVSKPSEN